MISGYKSQIELIDYGAEFSPCELYRYSLLRQWQAGPDMCMFIGLNPSTATATTDDPTIRRCIRFAHSWGYDGLFMANIFAFRSTDPGRLRREIDPIGPDNDCHIQAMMAKSGLIIAAWGNHGILHDRAAAVRQLLPAGKRLHCLGRNQSGEPKHPLYLAKTERPVLL